MKYNPLRNKGNFLNEKVREIPIMGAIAKITDWNSGGIRGFNFYENFQIDNVPVNHCENTNNRLNGHMKDPDQQQRELTKIKTNKKQKDNLLLKRHDQSKSYNTVQLIPLLRAN